MSSKKTAEKNSDQKGKEGRRALSVFPTDVALLSKDERARLLFKPDSMAEAIIQALEKHGVGTGDARKKVVEQVKGKFTKAHDATIRTQIYRGIVYLRATPRPHISDSKEV